ncbi:unnamed protein product [Urochloa humidicola]
MVAYARSMASSSTSGTFSTTYTSSRGSLAGELDLALQRFEDDEEKLKKRRERARGLVEGFRHGDSDTGAPERWLSEMGVGWVLDLVDDASAGASLLPRAQHNLTSDWIRALTEITGSTTLRFVREQDVLGPFQLVFKETVLKMLPFVDALLAAADLLDAGTDTADATNGTLAPSERKLQTLLDVRDAVSSASIGTKLCFPCWDSKVEMETQRSDAVLNHLSAKEQRLDEAVWNTMEEVRTSILNDDDNEWGIQTRQGSPGICKVTWSLVTYIKYLGNNYWRVYRQRHIVRTGSTAAKLGVSLTTLTMEMVSSLEVKLNERSKSFPDHSLRFIFLINNTHFIWQQLHPLFGMKFHMEALATKIEEYIQKYLQVSWEPVLSCLHNHLPRWMRKKSALPPKFDKQFQKTYTAQKVWKVPDPGLRTRLRKAIVQKVVSGFRKYLEDNSVTSPRVTPQEREKMLLELFEG